MAVQVKAVMLVQGPREFRVLSVALQLTGPAPNDTPQLVEPQSAPMTSPAPITHWSDS